MTENVDSTQTKLLITIWGGGMEKGRKWEGCANAHAGRMAGTDVSFTHPSCITLVLYSLCGVSHCVLNVIHCTLDIILYTVYHLSLTRTEDGRHQRRRKEKEKVISEEFNGLVAISHRPASLLDFDSCFGFLFGLFHIFLSIADILLYIVY